jgi:DNA-binding CsgD family transcriptional regulator
MPIQPATADLRNRVARLKELHVAALPARQAEVLVLLCLGFSEEEAAAGLGLSVSTVRTHWAAARDRVVPPAVLPGRPAATAWGWLHSSCCLASAFDAALRSNPAVAVRVASLAAHHVGSIPGREREILLLSAFGMNDNEIAASLFLSPSSVRSTAHHAHARVVPPELAPGRANASAWAHLHFCILHRPPGRQSRFGEIWQKRLVGQ